MSEGAGYCDCGDPEAWMKDIFCELHIKGCNQVLFCPIAYFSYLTRILSYLVGWR